MACPLSPCCKWSHSYSVLWKVKDPIYRTGVIRHMLISHGCIRFLSSFSHDARMEHSPGPLAYPSCSPARIFLGGWHSLFFILTACARLICLFVYSKQSCTSWGACAEHSVIPIPLQEYIDSFQQMEFLPVCGLIFWYGQPDENISESAKRYILWFSFTFFFKKNCISKEALTLRQQRFKIALGLLANISTSASWTLKKQKTMPALVGFNRQ